MMWMFLKRSKTLLFWAKSNVNKENFFFALFGSFCSLSYCSLCLVFTFASFSHIIALFSLNFSLLEFALFRKISLSLTELSLFTPFRLFLENIYHKYRSFSFIRYPRRAKIRAWNRGLHIRKKFKPEKPEGFRE